MYRNLLTPVPVCELPKTFEGGGTNGVVLASSGVSLLELFRIFDFGIGVEAVLEE